MFEVLNFEGPPCPYCGHTRWNPTGVPYGSSGFCRNCDRQAPKNLKLLAAYRETQRWVTEEVRTKFIALAENLPKEP